MLGFSGLWAELAQRADPAPGTLCLDVGTGTGGAALALAARGARVVALDLARGMLSHARRKLRARGPAQGLSLLRMDARRLGFCDGRFPLVTCCMALHEMGESERTQALAELRRVARERVIVAEYRVPASALGRAALRVGRAFEFLESDDFAAFLARGMPERLEAAGLEIVGAWKAGLHGIWSCRVAG